MTAAVPPATPAGERPGLWHRAPGWLFYGLTSLGAIGLIASASYPHGSLFLFIVAAWWSAGCAAVWLARVCTYVLGLSSHRSGRAWGFAVAPVMGIAVLALGSTTVPLDARWGLSRGAFEARADQLQANVDRGKVAPDDNQIRNDRVALYTVAFAHVDEEGNAYFSIAGSGFIDGGGFARLPDGPPQEERSRDFEPLGGDWYLWLDRFD